MAQYDIRGKTCLITGSASGIGAACVELYLREGAKFVVILDIAEDKGKALADKLSKSYPGKVKFIKCDVSDEASIAAAFTAVVNQVKQLDVVINNAGMANDTPTMWRNASIVNVQGVMSCSFKAMQHMRKDHGGAGGTIINVASMTAFTLSPAMPVYYATKAAVMHFSRCLAQDPFYSNTGIRVMTVCYSLTDTPMTQGLTERMVDPMHEDFVRDILNTLKNQRPECAAAATMTMFRSGDNGSVWLSQNGAPAQDITAVVQQAYQLMESVIVLEKFWAYDIDEFARYVARNTGHLN